MNRRYAVIALALVLLISGSANKCPGGGDGSCSDVVFDGASGVREPAGFPTPYIVTLDWTTSGWDGDVTYVVYGAVVGGEGPGPEQEVDRFTDAVGSQTWESTLANGGFAFNYFRIAVECDGIEGDSIIVDLS